jgi:hypothetical protein
MIIDISKNLDLVTKIGAFALVLGMSHEDTVFLLLQKGLNVTNASFVGRDMYIRTHWESQTDAEMAAALGCKSHHIVAVRKDLGLVKNGRIRPKPKSQQVSEQDDAVPVPKLTGEDLKKAIIELLPTKKIAEIARQFRIKFAKVKEIRNEEIERQILESNGSISDVDMAERFKVNWAKIMALRNQLGIKLDRKFKAIKTLEDKLDLKDLESALTEGGETMAGYIRAKELHTTRERLRQLCVSKNIPHQLKDRKPIWHINKIARDHDQAGFTDKEWVDARFAEARSLFSEFVPLVKLNPDLARRVLEFHGITWNKRSTKTPKSHEFVELVCSNPECAITFKRSKRTHESTLGKAQKKGSTPKTCCSRKCNKMIGTIRGGGGRASKIDPDWLDQNFDKLTNQEIADKFGMKPRSISNILRTRGLSRKKTTAPSE